MSLAEITALVLLVAAVVLMVAESRTENNGWHNPDLCKECQEKASPVGANRCAECVLDN